MKLPMDVAMKTGIVLFLTAAAVAANAGAGEGSACQHDENNFRCVKYVRNYDADTITVDIPGVHPLLGKGIGVRIRNIDSPEIRGSSNCEKDAARTAKKLIEAELKRAKRIDLENIGKDKYFRILADVKIDGKDAASLLVKNRLANDYDGGTRVKTDWCRFSAGGKTVKGL